MKRISSARTSFARDFKTKEAMKHFTVAAVLTGLTLCLVGCGSTQNIPPISGSSAGNTSNNSPAADPPQRNSFTFNQNIELLSARNDEQARLNSIDFFRDRNVHFHCGQTGCDNTSLFVDNGSKGRWLPGQKMPGTEEDMGLWSAAEKDEFVCALAKVEFRQSIFESVMVSKTHRDRLGVTKGKFQGIILLPPKMPAGCKLPPDVDGFR